MKAKKQLAVLGLSAILVFGALGLAACDEPATTTNPPTTTTQPAEQQNKYASYTPEQFATVWKEGVESRAISYQFTGSVDLGRGGVFTVCGNLYEDGLAVFYQRKNTSKAAMQYIGHWREQPDEDGNVIYINTVCVYSGSGTGETVLEHAYGYDLYEEDGGTYTLTLDICQVAGKYYREVTMTGDSTVDYKTFDDFVASLDA